MPQINFFQEDVVFTINNESQIRQWIIKVINLEGFQPKELSIIFCSDDYLHKMNRNYLNHDTYTDIITFDNSDEPEAIEGDIFISLDRVKNNAEDLKLNLEDELHRVIIHGVLHLMGYKDKTHDERKTMRDKEGACLELRN